MNNPYIKRLESGILSGSTHQDQLNNINDRLTKDYNTLLADPTTRTLWFNGIPYGNAYINIIEDDKDLTPINAEVFNYYDSIVDGTVKYGNVAKSNYSHTEGFQNYISTFSDNSHAEGCRNVIGSKPPTFEFDESDIEESGTMNSHVEGYNNTILAYGAHAEGKDNSIYSNAKYSHVSGLGNTVQNEAEFAIGKYNNSINGTTIFSVGIGTSNSERINALAIDNTGNLYLKGYGGYDGTTISENVTPLNILTGGIGKSTEQGGEIFNDYANNSAGKYAHAEGYNGYFVTDDAIINGSGTNNISYDKESNTFAISQIDPKPSYDNSTHYLLKIDRKYFFEIENIDVSGGRLTANLSNTEFADLLSSVVGSNKDWRICILGKDNKGAYGTYSHTEGYYNTSQGIASHTEGIFNKSNGIGSHSEGYNTNALGNYSHSEGFQTNTNGEASHAEGYQTTALGKYSHTSGNNTQATNESEFAIGKYNKSNTGSTIFSVGIGTSGSQRFNALEITNDGKLYLNGVGKYNGYTIENKKSINEKLLNFKSENYKPIIIANKAIPFRPRPGVFYYTDKFKITKKDIELYITKTLKSALAIKNTMEFIVSDKNKIYNAKSHFNSDGDGNIQITLDSFNIDLGSGEKPTSFIFRLYDGLTLYYTTNYDYTCESDTCYHIVSDGGIKSFNDCIKYKQNIFSSNINIIKYIENNNVFCTESPYIKIYKYYDEDTNDDTSLNQVTKFVSVTESNNFIKIPYTNQRLLYINNDYLTNTNISRRQCKLLPYGRYKVFYTNKIRKATIKDTGGIIKSHKRVLHNIRIKPKKFLRIKKEQTITYNNYYDGTKYIKFNSLSQYYTSNVSNGESIEFKRGKKTVLQFYKKIKNKKKYYLYLEAEVNLKNFDMAALLNSIKI